jgi:hypothetical protein
MPKRKVGEGNSTSSLALENGFFWRTIWEHGENAGLRQKRKDPNVLAADDDIFIPVRELKKVSKGTEAQHVFKRKGEPSKIKMQLLELGNPRKDEDYILEVAGELKRGKTDAEGKIEHFIPGNARSAKLIFKDGKEIHGLRLGSLDPSDLGEGVAQRLNNLGFKLPMRVKKGLKAAEAFAEDKVDKKVTNVIKAFQKEYDVEQTGKVDSKLIAKLDELAK